MKGNESSSKQQTEMSMHSTLDTANTLRSTPKKLKTRPDDLINQLPEGELDCTTEFFRTPEKKGEDRMIDNEHSMSLK